MIVGFIKGVLSGAAVVVASLVVLSVLTRTPAPEVQPRVAADGPTALAPAPPPAAEEARTAPAATPGPTPALPVTQPPSLEAGSAELAPRTPETPASAPEVVQVSPPAPLDAAPPTTPAQEPAAEADLATQASPRPPAPATAPDMAPVRSAPAPAPAPDLVLAAPDAPSPDAVAPGVVAEVAPTLPEGDTMAAAPQPGPLSLDGNAIDPAPGVVPDAGAAPMAVDDSPAAPPAPAVEPTEAAPEVFQPEPVDPEAGLPEDLVPLPSRDSAPAQAAAEPAPARPQPGLGDGVEGVTDNRLPQIAPAPPAEEAADPPEGAAEDTPVETTLPDPAAMTVFQSEARFFDNPDQKPLFAIILIDTGEEEIDRAALAALPFPISFALDPMDPASGARAAVYRAAGQEVLMLATGLPEGAQASDVEVALSVMGDALPQAVAMIDTPQGAFQGNRPLATGVVPVIASQGRGLVTWDRGLNAADQVARREGVPAGVIFRALDAEGESAPVIRRYLDRAAFKAAQEGRVIVAGSTRPETIAALMEWTVEGRSASVALAPVTAAMAPP